MHMVTYSNNVQYPFSVSIPQCLLIWIVALLILYVPVEVQAVDAKEKIQDLYDQYREEFAPVNEMSARAAIDHYLAGDSIVFIDVREPEERAVSTLPDALSVEEYLAAHDSFQDHIILAYCTIGYRSGLFARSREGSGQTIYNLPGGMLAWVQAGGPVFEGDKEVKRVHVYGAKWDLAPDDYDVVKFPFWKILFN